MQEFALYVDGAFSEIRRAETRPDDKERSGVAWYPVSRIEGERPGEKLVGDAHVITAAPPAAPPPRRTGTFREFMDLFTADEQKAIAAAAMGNVDVKLWYDRAMGGPSLDLDSPDTTAGLAALVAAGLLAQDRADAVAGADFNAAG